MDVILLYNMCLSNSLIATVLGAHLDKALAMHKFEPEDLCQISDPCDLWRTCPGSHVNGLTPSPDVQSAGGITF